MNKSTANIDFFAADTSTVHELLIVDNIRAGFPSPAEEYLEETIDLNKALITNPSSTFLGRVKGYSMIDFKVEPGDVIIVDRSLEPHNGNKVISFIDGAFTLKTIKIDKKSVRLMAGNPSFPPIDVTQENDFKVWGTVTYTIHKER